MGAKQLRVNKGQQIKRRESLIEVRVNRKEAEIACTGVEANAFENCVSDVLTIEDLDISLIYQNKYQNEREKKITSRISIEDAEIACSRVDDELFDICVHVVYKDNNTNMARVYDTAKENYSYSDINHA